MYCAKFVKSLILLLQSNKEGCAIERKPKRKLRDTKAINQINKERYDRLNIVIPKGQKAVVEEKAKERNESVNQFTNRALLERMGYEEWPELIETP